MYDVTYHRATSVDDAAEKFAAASDGQLLAGGQTLLPTMKHRLAAPSDLIDLRGIADLVGVRVSGRSVTIGAMTTHAAVAENAELAKVCPAIVKLAGGIGDPAVRHQGTIGGSIANNDPAADYPAGLMALGATIHTNRREIAADDFFTGLFSTALDEGEIVTAVSFDAPETCGYAKFPNPASRYAMTGVFVAKGGDGAVRVAVTGAGSDGVFRHEGLEQALSKDWSSAAVDGVSVSADGLMSDIHCDAAYRANLIKAMAKRALA
ncbi:xanthine dehydrogenase family protein subunit M [Nitratireductor sp. GZWM139]|uniref:FAD binding domain-containing protein n=1 Tax=Nitratireductor sp. GZWM139 TaxID=2950541 RepID=UPI0024BDB10B|nr:xanthine dehydrogenase family protein subunit M [Nitratireductor sp. GZWM139]MDJ1463607.1 xanthine dehydrogenase family protein subunit M [Nitratireductor sp. GZWM139]